MTTKEVVIQEIRNIPEAVCGEILDFVRFLKLKERLEKNDTSLMSEKSLAKDWLKPEEDEAWQNL